MDLEFQFDLLGILGEESLLEVFAARGDLRRDGNLKLREEVLRRGEV